METTDGVGHFLYLYISTNTLFRQIYKNQYSTPRAENFFTRKFLQPAFEFLTGQKLASISSSQAQANQVPPDTKKNAPRGAHFFFILSRNLISSEAMKEHSVNSGLPRAENFFTRKFLQPAFEFLSGKTRFYFFLTGSGKSGCSRNKKKRPAGRFFFIFSRNLISSARAKEHSVNSGLPRAENLFARKFLQPAFEFLTGQKLASIPSSQAQANQLAPDTKKKRPAGRFLSLCKTKNYLNKLSTFWLDWFA